MKQRFIIKYCKVIDAVLLLDTLKRMPLTMIIDKICYVHGLICMDMERAKEQQEYYESLFGYQRPLIQPVTRFIITSERWLGNPDYGMNYSIYDNTGNHVLSSLGDESCINEFKEWLEKELEEFKKWVIIMMYYLQ